MKSILITLCFLTPVLAICQNPEVDPKLTPEEQQLMLNPGEAPAKAQFQVDEKLIGRELENFLNPGEAPGDASSEPDEKMDPDNPGFVKGVHLDPEISSTHGLPQVSAHNNEQPSGEVADHILNRRTLKGKNTQPVGKVAEHVLDRRTINGPGTQPPGDEKKPSHDRIQKTSGNN